MQKLCCVRTIQQSSASWDYLSRAYQPISPSILIHFQGELYQISVRDGILDWVTEPHCHNQSKVGGVVREIRKRWFRIMLKKKVPKWLWDYGIKWVCEVMQHTASTSRDLSGQTALEQLTGEAPEISEYLDFTFYDWCWYNDNEWLGEMKLGHWLGVSHRVVV